MSATFLPYVTSPARKRPGFSLAWLMLCPLNISRCLPPTTPTIAGAERVHSMRVLGVTINQHLTMSDHVDNLIASGASFIYALRMLRSHGLQPKQLQMVARMMTIASLLYASPARW